MKVLQLTDHERAPLLDSNFMNGENCDYEIGTLPPGSGYGPGATTMKVTETLT